MQFKTKILLLFLIIFSCKISNKVNQDLPKKLLIPIKVGLGVEGNKESYIKTYKIKFKKNTSNNTVSIFLDNKRVIDIINNNKNYLFEMYDNQYLLISEYTNIGAAGPSLMKRVNIFILDINNPLNIYKYSKGKIRLTMSENKLEYYKKSSVNNDIHCISDINNGFLSIKDVNHNVSKVSMQELKVGITIGGGGVPN